MKDFAVDEWHVLEVGKRQGTVGLVHHTDECLHEEQVLYCVMHEDHILECLESPQDCINETRRRYLCNVGMVEDPECQNILEVAQVPPGLWRIRFRLGDVPAGEYDFRHEVERLEGPVSEELYEMELDGI